MSKVHVTIKFKNSDTTYTFMANKPGRYDSNYAERIGEALADAPIGLLFIQATGNPGAGIIINLGETRETRQPNAKAEIQIALRKKAGYKTFVNLPK